MGRAFTITLLLPALVALISAAPRAQDAADGQPAPEAAPAAAAPEAPAVAAAPEPDANCVAGIHHASLLLQAKVSANHGQYFRMVDLVCDLSVGILQYAVLDVGPLADKDDRMLCVPVNVMKVGLDTVHARLLVYDRDTLAAAPRFPPDRWPRDSDREWVGKVWRHFRHKPYWEDLPAADSREQKHAFTMLRLSRLIGTTIVNPRGLKLGQVEDFAVDMKRGKVLYVIVSPAVPATAGTQGAAMARAAAAPSAERIAVPWWALERDTPSPRLLLDMNPERVLKAPTFPNDHWPDLSTSGWSAGNDAFYEFRSVKLPKLKPGY